MAQIEQTLVLLKPDAVQRGLIGDILARYEKRGLRIAAPQPMEIVGPPAAVLIREHLEEHAGEAPVRLRLDAIGGDAA